MSESTESGVIVSAATVRETKAWLSDRESDIAVGWEDLGELRSLFVELFGREPKD